MKFVIEPERFKKFVHASLIFDGGKAMIDNVKAVLTNGQLIVKDLSKQTFAVDSVYDKSFFIELSGDEGEILVLHPKMLEFIDDFMGEERITVVTKDGKLIIHNESGKTEAEHPLVAPNESTYPIKMVATNYGILPEPMKEPVFRGYFDTETLAAIKKSPRYLFTCENNALKVTMSDDTGTSKLTRELVLKGGPEPALTNPFKLNFTEGPLRAMLSNIEGEVWVHFNISGLEAIVISSKRKDYLRTYILAASAE